MTTDQATKTEQTAGSQTEHAAGAGPLPGQSVRQAGPVAGQVGGYAPGLSAEPGAPRVLPARSRSRRTAGGRWLVWGLRAVVWAVLLLIGYRGVVAIVTGSPSPGGGAAGSHAGATGAGRVGSGPSDSNRTSGHGPASSGKAGVSQPRTGRGSTGSASTGVIDGSVDGFPVALAQAYVLDFAHVYLSFSPASAAQRAAALAPFLPPGTNAQLGYDGKGTQTLQSVQVAATHVLSAHVAIVTLLAEVNGKLIELGVPIYASGGAMVVSGKPALLPPPPKATIPAARAQPGDKTTEAALARRLPAFFSAFAASSVVRSPSLIFGHNGIAGLNGVVTFNGIAAVSAPAAGGTTRHITVTVIWRTPGQVKVRTSTVANIPASIAMTYALTVVERNGNWYVESIGASPAVAG